MEFHLSRRRGSAVARRLWLLLLVAALPLGSACRDNAVGPPLEEIPTQAEIAVYLPSLEDAINRLAPAIIHPEVRTQALSQLQSLRTQLGARDIAPARSTTNALVRTLDNYVGAAGLESPDMAEVAGIQLVAFHLGKLLRMQIDPSLLLHLGIPES